MQQNPDTATQSRPRKQTEDTTSYPPSMGSFAGTEADKSAITVDSNHLALIEGVTDEESFGQAACNPATIR